MMTRFHWWACLLILLLTCRAARGQELHDSLLFEQQGRKETTIAELTHQSSAVLEGRLLASRTFWNPAHTIIYTALTIQVYKVFKGDLTSPTIELLTLGGRVGDEGQDYPLLNPNINELHQVGLLFLKPSREASVKSSLPRNVQFEAVMGRHGALPYSTGAETTADSQWRRYHQIERTLYAPLQRLVGQPYREIAYFDINQYSEWQEKAQGRAIPSVRPASAGPKASPRTPRNGRKGS